MSGAITVGVAASFWALFLPLDNFALIAFVLGAVILFCVKRVRRPEFSFPNLSPLSSQNFSSAAADFVRPQSALRFAVFYVMVIAVFASFVAKGSGVAFSDTGLYHAQIVKWLNACGDVCGVGNLHGRLATNSLYLTLAALIDNWLLDGRSAYVLPVVFWSAAFGYFGYAAGFYRDSAARVYAAIFSVWCAWVAVGGPVSLRKSPQLYYDDPANILHAAAFLEAWVLLRKADGGTTAGGGNFSEKVRQARLVLWLATGAFLIKPIGAVAVLFALVVIFYAKFSRRDYLRITLPAVAAFIIWIAGNIILSGYPFFPFPYVSVGSWGLDWRLPRSVALGVYNDARGWARLPGAHYRESLTNGLWFWLVPWSKRAIHDHHFVHWAIIPLTISAALWRRAWKNRERDNREKILFGGFALLAIVYWFVAAPDIRFVTAFFWTLMGAAVFFLPASDLAWLTAKTQLIGNFLRRPRMLGIAIVAAILCTAALSRKRQLLTVAPIRSEAVKEFRVPADPPFSVYVPISGALTGNSPLPSMPYPNEKLRLRRAGDLSAGFYLEK